MDRIKALEETIREKDRLLEEERRRREEIEETTRGSSLQEFLERCHDLHTSVQVVTDKTLTTQGEITNPDNRLYPKRILRWQDFEASQAAVWARIGESSDFASRQWFPSRNDFAYVRDRLRPISSESQLRWFEALAIENMVVDLFQRAREDASVKQVLGVDSEINFQDHTNLGDDGNSELARMMQDLRLQQSTKRTERQQSPHRHRGTADQFCVLQSADDGSRRPSLAIEFKAPHKLSTHTVSAGLKEEIQTYEDVISQIEEPSDAEQRQDWWCQYVMAATLTQLFSYMVTQGTRYGYLSTGQAYVFLRIGDDPSEVYFSVQIPSLDVSTNDERRLHHTAVAQVFAFIVQAAGESGPAQDWHQRRDLLSPWKVDLQSILHAMPESIRTNCRPDEDAESMRKNGRGSDEEGRRSPESPSEQRRRRIQTRSVTRGRGTQAPSNHGNATQGSDSVVRSSVKERPYCTHSCLLGLAEGGDLDSYCPNSRLHGSTHLRRKDFLHLVKQQLLVDTGVDASCVPLNIHGARGGLLKVTLAAHGYTFVAKGSEKHNFKHLHNERQTYRRLRTLQGTHVPVCLGLLELRRVYHYSGARLSHLLLMSWGGRPLSAPLNKTFQVCFPKLAESALTAIHREKIRHNDAEPRNMIFDIASMRLMVIDFERSTSISSPSFARISSNGVTEQTAKKRIRYRSAEDELVAMRNCMHRFLQ
ncbi:hypothetical protein LTR09_012274 [Extremus antarcticus]|uniref:Protein kinase domain-containing protein n=1 Tax=Extremus antarcticus TaxID=702011 RepID=A0AAJ0G9H5_9PEZI|nr:hypothetical protein LTR09_012274 [Extremus antarcticus]